MCLYLWFDWYRKDLSFKDSNLHLVKNCYNYVDLQKRLADITNRI